MDDLISRQAAIDALYELFRNRPLDYGRVQIRGDVLMTIENIPSAERHGRWIKEPNCYYRCSVCGDHHPCIKSNMDYNFCPNCGASMMDEVEE